MSGKTTTEMERAPKTGVQTEERPRRKRPVPWNVVLLDDDHHSYEYVIKMMHQVFGHPLEKAFQIARKVDSDGRAVCATTHKEHAELKRDQVLGFGRDSLVATCQGSMTAVIEPAEHDGDDDDA